MYKIDFYLFALLCLVVAVFCFRIIELNKTWKNNLTLWTHTLTISPDCMIAHLNLGNHYMRNNSYQEALYHYRETARIDPDFALGKQNVARCLRNLDKTEAAISWYKSAVKTLNRKSPRSWSVHTEYADYLSQLGQTEAALAEYKLILKKNPPTADKIKKTIQALQSRSN